MAFGKLFDSTFTGSMYGSGACVFAVWSYVIANTRQDSRVELNPQLLANVIGEDQDRIEGAIDKLCSPDPRSRSKVAEGRRLIREGQFLYTVPNHSRYRSIRDDLERREYNKLAKRKERAKRQGSSSHKSTSVNRGQPRSAQAEADTEAEADKHVGVSSFLFPGLDPQPTSEPPAPAVRKRRGVKRSALQETEELPEGEITADQAFDVILWPEYPRKKDKEPARAAWKALKLKDTDEASILAIMRALRSDIKNEWRDRPPDKIPYGATWLRRKGWLDG